MAKKSGYTINRKALREITKQVIDTEGVARMQRVADQCNADAGITDGYMVSVEGDDPLDKRDYRATVITATAEAINADRKHDYLLRNFGVAEG